MSPHLHRATRLRSLLLIALTAGFGPLANAAADTSATQQLERFSTHAGSPGRPARGQELFTQRHGSEWSCSSCHGNPPLAKGKHASTGKAIDAFAPASNPDAFTNTAKVDKWFRRNCNDVFKRECSAGEKADLLAYVIQLRP